MSDRHKGASSVWGPDACRAAASVTFDNLGEAADLERGLWPEDEPLGRHFSVKRTLPRILDTLEELGLRATFFAEGLNTELYPDALLEIDNFLARTARKPRFYLLLASGPRDRLPRQLGCPAIRVAADRRLLLPAALRQSSEECHRVERADVPVPLPGDAKLSVAGRRPRRWAPNPAISSVLGRAGRLLRDYARSARRAAGSSRRWVGLVRTVPGHDLLGPRTSRSVRQRAPARPY